MKFLLVAVRPTVARFAQYFPLGSHLSHLRSQLYQDIDCCNSPSLLSSIRVRCCSCTAPRRPQTVNSLATIRSTWQIDDRGTKMLSLLNRKDPSHLLRFQHYSISGYHFRIMLQIPRPYIALSKTTAGGRDSKIPAVPGWHCHYLNHHGYLVEIA